MMIQEMKQQFDSNHTVWKYNGNSFVLDLEDQDDIERFEEAVRVLESREKNLPKDGPLSLRNGAYCNAYCEFFDSVFGAGSAEKIFNGKRNSRVCDFVYFEEFIPFIRNQSTEKNNRSRSMVNKYKPNREQRRQQGNGNRGQKGQSNRRYY